MHRKRADRMGTKLLTEVTAVKRRVLGRAEENHYFLFYGLLHSFGLVHGGHSSAFI